MNDTILEVTVFKKRVAPNKKWQEEYCVLDSFDVYLVGLAYRGRYIAKTVLDFLYASRTDLGFNVTLPDSTVLHAGGNSRIVGYMGHNGLMEHPITPDTLPASGLRQKGVFVLACVSNWFFNPLLELPIIDRLAMTTDLMGPFAYVTSGLIESVLLFKTHEERLTRMARAYDKYQKCGVKGARGLFE